MCFANASDLLPSRSLQLAGGVGEEEEGGGNEERCLVSQDPLYQAPTPQLSLSQYLNVI